MTSESWFAIVGTIGFVVLSPGPSVLLVWVHRVQYGPSAVPPTVAGDLSANALQITVAWFGLVRLQAIGIGGRMVVWVGAAYLGYLGARRIWGPEAVAGTTPAKGMTTGPGPVTLFARGFAVSAANPKAIVFFAAILPASIGGGAVGPGHLLIVGATFAVMDGSALFLYARAGGRVRAFLQRHDRQDLEGRIVGGALLVTAVLLAWRARH